MIDEEWTNETFSSTYRCFVIDCNIFRSFDRKNYWIALLHVRLNRVKRINPKECHRMMKQEAESWPTMASISFRFDWPGTFRWRIFVAKCLEKDRSDEEHHRRDKASLTVIRRENPYLSIRQTLLHHRKRSIVTLDFLSERQRIEQLSDRILSALTFCFNSANFFCKFIAKSKRMAQGTALSVAPTKFGNFFES